MERRQIIAAIIILLLVNLVQTNISAQELIFEMQPGRKKSHTEYGPNRRHYIHPFLSSSITFASERKPTLNTDQPLTGQLKIGYRYKLTVIKPLAIVTECGINHQFFKIHPTSGLFLSDSLLHRFQSIRTTGPFGGIYLRLRMGQRGDYLGNYFDFGVVVQASSINTLITKDIVDSNDSKTYRSEKTTISDLKIVNPFSYSLSMRVGFDRISLIASYRISRLLSISYGQDLPDLQFGLEISPVIY